MLAPLSYGVRAPIPRFRSRLGSIMPTRRCSATSFSTYTSCIADHNKTFQPVVLIYVVAIVVRDHMHAVMIAAEWARL